MKFFYFHVEQLFITERGGKLEYGNGYFYLAICSNNAKHMRNLPYIYNPDSTLYVCPYIFTPDKSVVALLPGNRKLNCGN